MSAYAAPLRDMKFVINELVGISDITAMPECAEITGDLVDADVRCARSAETDRHCRTESALSAEADCRHMGRHDEFDGASSRLGLVRGPHPRRSRRRPLPLARHEDFHHVGRT